MTRLWLLALVIPATALADWEEGDDFVAPTPFRLEGAAPGGAHPAPPAPAYLTASRIAALGEGALAIDADSGILFATGADGAVVRSFAIGRDAGLLALDPIAHRAYVADRRGDRVVVVAAGETLAQVAQWRTPVEPYAIALTPDRSRVLVAAIADRALVAYDPAGAELWRVPLASEPRGLAVSPDGTRALVTYLATGFADEVSLAAAHAIRHVALPVHAGEQARGAFAATYLGDHLAAIAYQRERPEPDRDREVAPGRYGGGLQSPISDHFAFVGDHGAIGATTQITEPRALAWNGARDALYLAGLGSDLIIHVARASQVDPEGMAIPIGAGCGIDGLAIGAGDKLLAWCAFTRSVLIVGREITQGPSLIPSTLDAERHAGFVAFYAPSSEVTPLAGLACGSCHLDGRTDGMSWRIAGRDLQTPMLAGRLAGTAPFKWDGGAPDLPASIRATIARLGGGGLGKAAVAQLAAYLETIPAVRVPTRDPALVARGKARFDALGCATCHDGTALTDRQLHRCGKEPPVDTPSLVGLAASAPYLHDGSAATLEVLLRERGTIHGMAEASRELSDTALAELVAYLETR